MSSVAKTSIQVNTSQATAALKNLNISLTSTVGSFGNMSHTVKETEAATKNLTVGTKKQAQAQQQANNTAKQGQSAFAGLKNKILGLAAAYVSLQSAKKFIDEADNYASTTARLNTMNDGLQTTDELYNKIYKSAQRSRGSFNETANAITKLGIVAGDSFKSNDEIIAFIETFNKAAVVSGSSATEASNAMYQLSQAFASGRLQGDELRSVRENAPMLFKAIQKELEAQYGKGVDFKKLAADGLISPDVIKAAAFKSAGEIDKAFKSMPMTFGQTMTQAFNKITAGLAPIFKEVSAIINNPAVKNGINTVVNLAIKGIYWVWGAIKKLGSAIGWLIETFDYWKWAMYAVLGVMAIVKTATMIQAIWNGILAVKTAIITFIESVRTKGLWATFAAMLAVNTTMLIAVAIIIAIVAAIILIIKYLDYVVGAAYWCGALFTNIWLWIKDTVNVCWIGMQLGAQKAFSAILKFVLTVADKIANAFISVFNEVVGFINKLISAVGDTALGEKLGLSGVQIGTLKRSNLVGENKLLQGSLAAEKDLEAQLNAAMVNKPKYKNLGQAFDKGFAKGGEWKKGITDGLKGVGNKLGITGGTSLDKALGNIGDPSSFGSGDDATKKALGDIADNTKQTANNTGKEDDYSLLRDVMAQRATTRLGNSGGTVKIEMVNNNNLSSKLDVNSFVAQIANAITEAASTGTQGVHI